jgi:hypothetical protein
VRERLGGVQQEDGRRGVGRAGGRGRVRALWLLLLLWVLRLLRREVGEREDELEEVGRRRAQFSCIAWAVSTQVLGK